MEWKKPLKIKEELLTILSTGLSSAPHPSISVTQQSTAILLTGNIFGK